jgi:leader peptidase (prepilin peptidase)/N-methyltransferase
MKALTDPSLPDSENILTKATWGWSLLTGAVVLAVGLTLLSPAEAISTALLAFLMAVITLTDLRHYIIPDVISLPAIPLGVIANVATFHASSWPDGLWESCWGAAIGGGVFFLLREGYYRWRKVEGLGLGDVKLAAVAGAWLGPFPLPSVFLFASLAAIIVVLVRGVARGGVLSLNPQQRLPFGSFIAPFILIFWLIGLPELITWW